MCVGGGGYAGRVPGVTWCAARTVLLSVGPGAAQQERGREVSSWRGAATRSQLAGAMAGQAPCRARAVRAGPGTKAPATAGPWLSPAPRLAPDYLAPEGGPETSAVSVAGVRAPPNHCGCPRE